VLVWSDIVRASMGKGIAATYAQLLRTAWTYARTGALRRLMRLRKGPVIAAFYPVAVLLGQLALALLAARAAGAAAAALVHPWAAALGLAVVWPVLAWFRRRTGGSSPIT